MCSTTRLNLTATKFLSARHINVAQLVGATEGCDGLNGIVVVMGKCIILLRGSQIVLKPSITTDGIDFKHFESKTHSGAAWAKYVSMHGT